MRYARPSGSNFRVLEVGCGVGANIPLFLHLGVDYVGIDGSESAIKRLKSKYPSIAESLHVMDFTKNLPSGKFDLIVDRAAITHNSTVAIKQCLDLISNQLRDDGKFIGIDWFSTHYSDYANDKIGEITTDSNTKKFGDESRSFSNLGNVHFSDEGHLKYDLFETWEIANLQHKVITEVDDGSSWNFASFNFVAVKK